MKEDRLLEDPARSLEREERESDVALDAERRRFIQDWGRYALYTPPVVLALMLPQKAEALTS